MGPVAELSASNARLDNVLEITLAPDENRVVYLAHELGKPVPLDEQRANLSERK